MKRFTDQDSYTSFERGGDYKPRAVADTANALKRRYQEFEARQSRYMQSVNAQQQSEQAALQQQINNTKQVNANIQKLSDMVSFFGGTAINTGQAYLEQVESDARKNFSRELAEYGLTAEEAAKYNAGRQNITDIDEQVNKELAKSEKAGVPYELLDRLSNATGRAAIGMREAYANHMGLLYPQMLQDRLANDNETVFTDADGDFTPTTAGNNPARVQAVMNLVQEDVIENLERLSPGVQDIAYAHIRKYREQYLQQTRTANIKELKQQALTEAETELTNSLLKYPPDVMGWQRAVKIAQTKGGLTPVEARKRMIELAYVVAQNQRNPEIVEQIGATLIESTGKTVSESYAGEFARVTAKVNEMNRKQYQQEEQDIRLKANRTAREALTMMQQEAATNGLTREEGLAIIERWQAQNPGMPVPDMLQNYVDNMSLQEIDLKDQEKEILQGIYEQKMTLSELESGKYSPELVAKYRQKASEISEASAVIQTKATKESNDSLESAIEGISGINIADNKEPSVDLAIGAAKVEVARRARILLSSSTYQPDPGRERIEQAWSDATMAVIDEIDSKKGRWATNGQMGDDFAFVGFDRGELAQAKVERAQQQMKLVNDTVLGGGVAAVKENTNNIYTEAEVNSILNPRSQDPVAVSKFARIANSLTASGKPITTDQVMQLAAEHYGKKITTPFTRDEYTDNAMSTGLVNYLNQPTNARLNAVAVQGDLMPVVIRKGYQHYRDVNHAAKQFGFPTHLLPLVSGVYGLESGWGEYPSGRNNVFNIKGRGTVVEGSEYRDYKSVQESIGDFVELMKDPRYKKVMSAKTPFDAVNAMKEAGYAEDPEYVNKMLGVFSTMGINPYEPYEYKPLTKSAWSNPALMGVQAVNHVYTTGNIGPTSTGPHLDIKRLDRQYFEYSDFDKYIEVDDPELGRVPLSKVPQTGDWASHTRRGSHGRDYGTFSGTKVYLRNGARELYTQKTEHGDYTVIELPTGVKISFLHGTKK